MLYYLFDGVLLINECMREWDLFAVILFIWEPNRDSKRSYDFFWSSWWNPIVSDPKFMYLLFFCGIDIVAN